ncbi:MAG TPA: glycine C-acetyltransferase [Opitutaceae bacterium]|nr:glycine C-acetyltransferase [Opitutaceae bacterium]
MSLFLDHVRQTLTTIDTAGLTKRERIIDSAQGAHVVLRDGRRVLNLCANNYLGLANHPKVIRAAHDALDRWGYGLASVRFICGTQTLHQTLEARLSQFLGTEDTVLYPSAFDANGGLFETLLTAEDAVISDELNHASIIDGIRLCKARRFRYRHNDMADLEVQLRAARSAGARFLLIATDGVFSMDGTIADLPSIVRLAEQYDALTMVDDCHATGFLGPRGRGSHDYHGLIGRIDLLTGTLGKALGGASGGYTSGRREVMELLRQRSRPYLFSNSIAPPVVAGALAALDLLESSSELRERLTTLTAHWRSGLAQLGLTLKPGTHPITPVMLGEARVAQSLATRLLERGIYVVAFAYPVVPEGKARIRTQISAAHSPADLDFALEQWAKALMDAP